MCVLSLEDGMAAESWYAWLAFRTRVSMSAMGSVIVMRVVPLSPRFLSLSGASRRAGPLGDRWCGPLGERTGWDGLPAGLGHAGELPRVRHLPEADAAQAELAEDRVRPAATLAAGVAAHLELRLAGRLVDQSLLGHRFFSLARLSGWS